MVIICRTSSNAAGKVAKPANQDLRRVPTSECRASHAQVCSSGVRIDRFQALVVVHGFMVSADANRVCEPWSEDVSLLQRQELSRAQSIELNVIQSVRRRVRSFVEHVCAEKTVIVSEFVIHPRGKKVFVDNLLARERIRPRIPVSKDSAGIGQVVEGKVLSDSWVDSDLMCATRI